jgi:hypothetical protein
VGCAIKMPDGSPCLWPPNHHWGKVEFCCEHFDRFIEGLFDLKTAVEVEKGQYKPSHLELIEEYNRRTKRTSVIPGAACDAEKKKPGGRE